MKIHEHLLKIADAGLLLSEQALDVPDLDDDVFTHLNTLLSIEDALDQGRVSAALLNTHSESTSELLAKMDELRRRIKELIDQCDGDEFQAFMASRARRLQTQFTKPSS